MSRQRRTFSIKRLVRALQGFSISSDDPRLVINRLLCDTTHLLTRDPEEVERIYEKNPLVLFGLLEISQLASLFSGEVIGDRAFLEYFQKRPPISCFLYSFSKTEEFNSYSTSGIRLSFAEEPADIVGFVQDVLRFAHLFYNCQPGDIFYLGKLLHSRFLAGVVIWEEPDEFELNVIRALVALSMPIFSAVPLFAFLNYIPIADMDDLFLKVRSLKPTIGAHRVERKEAAKSSHAPIKAKDFGGTYSSFFVVRAMGGTDGVEVRGSPGPDVGLIVDIGDEDVDIGLSLFIEEELLRTFSHHPWMRFNADGFFKLTVELEEPDAVELGQEIYERLKERLLLNQVSVKLIFDAPRLATLKPSISAYKEERKNAILKRSDSDCPILVCTYCQRYARNGFCIATVNHPPQCELSYDAVRASALLTNSIEAFSIERGELIDRNNMQFTGVNKFARILSEGEIKTINLQSIRHNPPPITAYAQNLAYFNEEVSGIFILSRDFEGSSPDGKTYFDLLKKVVGKQVNGVIGLSDAYLMSKKFLASEGGLGRVVWMPSVLKKRLGFDKFVHIATELECNTMLLLRAFLKERGFTF